MACVLKPDMNVRVIVTQCGVGIISGISMLWVGFLIWFCEVFNDTGWLLHYSSWEKSVRIVLEY